MITDRAPISLVIADDHPVVLQGIVGVLSGETDFEILDTCRTGVEALRAVSGLKPDVAVLDIAMPDMTGLDAMHRMQTEGIFTKVILLTANATDGQLLAAIERGARAFLLKDMSMTDLAPIIRRVAAGERCFPHDLVDAALEREFDRKAAGERFKVVSPREREVMLLVAEGISNKEIGNRLNLSEGTVKIHLHKIYQKVGIKNRTTLAALVLAQQSRQAN